MSAGLFGERFVALLDHAQALDRHFEVDFEFGLQWVLVGWLGDVEEGGSTIKGAGGAMIDGVLLSWCISGWGE